MCALAVPVPPRHSFLASIPGHLVQISNSKHLVDLWCSQPQLMHKTLLPCRYCPCQENCVVPDSAEQVAFADVNGSSYWCRATADQLHGERLLTSQYLQDQLSGMRRSQQAPLQTSVSIGDMGAVLSPALSQSLTQSEPCMLSTQYQQSAAHLLVCTGLITSAAAMYRRRYKHNQLPCLAWGKGAQGPAREGEGGFLSLLHAAVTGWQSAVL